MRILVTNDDGISAPGLRLLTEFALTLGEVTVIAPKLQQSCQSMAINIRTPFEAKRTELFPGAAGWSIGSTPADCVRFAVCGLREHFDLCLSGINDGLNAGLDIAYSSTCAALFEASFWGIPAVAFSAFTGELSGAEAGLRPSWEYIREHRLLETAPILNVNFPHHCKGIRLTEQKQMAFIQDHLVPAGADMIRAEAFSPYRDDKDLRTDLDAIMNGYISVTPLTADRTDREALRHIYESICTSEVTT